MPVNPRVGEILDAAKRLAVQYHELTGRPLGITGEVGEYEARRCLSIQLAAVRQAGYDATEKVGGKTRHIQIKTRCLQRGLTPGQRLGSINPKKEWDAILMVLLDKNLETTAIYEASRERVLASISRTESKARARGALTVRELMAIGQLRWGHPLREHR